MSDLIKAKEILYSGEYTCVIIKGEQTYTSVSRGVKPLVKWYADGVDLTGFYAADKVVGKATAFLYVLLGVKEVFAKVMSVTAKSVLEEQGIKAQYESLVPNIINRQGDGICPFEEAVLSAENKNEAYEIIRNKMQEMGISL